jgi:predicted AlkP superfamily phosphohydrolase/phosphomutase
VQRFENKEGTRNMPDRSPVVIIGLDAGDPGFIERWAATGHLPAIASLMAKGCYGQTGGPELISEHAVWVVLFSGLSRGQHGYYYFRQLKPGTYDLETVTGLDVDAPPIWRRLLGSDIKVAIVDVPDTAPVPGLAGLQLANWATHTGFDPHRFHTTSEPPELTEEIVQKFGPRLIPIEELDSSLEEDQALHRHLLERVELKGALSRHLLAKDRFDLVAIVFSESHAASHQFWGYGPAVQQGSPELRHGLRDVYQAVDRQIGLLLEELPSDANVFIVSSVGMADDYPTTGLIQAFCRQLGYQVPPETSGVSLRPLDLARRVIPESWRIALSSRLPRESREQLLSDQLRTGSDWSKTTAFVIPSPYTSFVRVNLQGREPQGIVAPGSEYEALLNRLEDDLKLLVDPETGDPAVKRVARTVDLFGCGPHESLPDLFVEWREGRFMQRVVHPQAELVQQKPDFFRRSDHASHGFFAAAGPQISQGGAIGEIDVLDLAPTFLSMLDAPIPRQLRGKVIDRMVRR